MFRSLFAGACALFCMSTSAFACSVPTNTSNEINQLVAQHGGWPISDAQCALLNNRHLYLQTTGMKTVLAGVSIGWVAIRLTTEDNVMSTDVRSSTHVDTGVASMDRAESLLYEALRDAMTKFDFEKAGDELAPLAPVPRAKKGR